jgi:hypothetical protein
MRKATAKEIFIFGMFNGHCHFCGDEITLEKRGYSAHPAGHWEADHVVMKKNGGSDKIGNLLPACTRCNRLRWGRSGRSLRRVLTLGLVAKEAAFNFHESNIGPQVRAGRIQQLGENWYRRNRDELHDDLEAKRLTNKKFKTEVVVLKKRRRTLTKALAKFENEALEQLRSRRGQKWDDVLTRLRERYRKAGTHRAWLAAERALGE